MSNFMFVLCYMFLIRISYNNNMFYRKKQSLTPLRLKFPILFYFSIFQITMYCNNYMLTHPKNYSTTYTHNNDLYILTSVGLLSVDSFIMYSLKW